MKKADVSKKVQTKSQEYDNEKRIVFFKNDKFGEKDQPVYRGYTWVSGVKYNFSVWAKTDSNGKLYFQGVLEDRTENTAKDEAKAQLDLIESVVCQ